MVFRFCVALGFLGLSLQLEATPQEFNTKKPASPPAGTPQVTPSPAPVLNNLSPAATIGKPPSPSIPATGTGDLKQKKIKRPKVKASAQDVGKPAATEAPPQETTKIEPDLVYRMAGLTKRDSSVFAKEEHKDFVDQLYLTLRFTKSYDFRHDVVIEPSVRSMRNNPTKLETTIEQAFVRVQPTEHIVVTAGKKAEYEGSGMVMNPSDLLNEQKDFFDPLYQREGKVFARIAAKLERFSAGAGYIPLNAGNRRQGKLWLQAATEILETDLRLQETFQQTEKATSGISISRFFGDSFELHYDGRYQLRQRTEDKQRERGCATWQKSPDGECPWTYKEADPSMFYVAGGRYVITNKRTIILEGIQNQSGLTPDEFEIYYQRFERDKEESRDSGRDPDTRLLGRHYAFARYQDEDSLPKTTFAGSYLMNFDDKSTFIIVETKYTFSPLTSMEFTPTFFRAGNRAQYTEFGEMPFSQAIYLTFRGRF